MYRAERKLVRNGNATGINLPTPLMNHLGWLSGQMVIVELLEDKSIRIRQRTRDDFIPPMTPRVVYDEPGIVR